MDIIYIDVMNDSSSELVGSHRLKNLFPKIKYNIKHIFTGNRALDFDIKNACSTNSGFLLTMSGHGTYQYIDDYNDVSVLNVYDVLHPYVAGNIIHLHACYTGGQLGQELINNGCRAFFGYNNLFVGPDKSDPEAHLLDVFMMPDEVLVSSLNNDQTPQQASLDSLQAYDNAIKEVIRKTKNTNYHMMIQNNKAAFTFIDGAV